MSNEGKTISHHTGIVSRMQAVPAERRDRERRRVFGQSRPEVNPAGDAVRCELDTGDDDMSFSFEIPAADAKEIRIGQEVTIEVKLTGR